MSAAIFKVKGERICYELPSESKIEQNLQVSSDRLVVLLNNKCNFNCIYCYSAMGRKQPNPELKLSDIKPSIDYICSVQEQKENGCIQVSFYGGGEPFVSRNVLQETVNYIKERAHNIRSDIKIMTNGSLLRSDDLQWLKDNDITLVFSFEIFEDIQKEQRGSYAIVDRNIKMVDCAGIKYRLWTVVTPRNVNRLGELLDVVHDNYPNVQRVNIELVVSDECSFELQDKFLKAFFVAKRKADALGICILNSRIGCFGHPKARHCTPELCIAFDGSYTICHTTASNPDIKDMFDFGKDLDSFIQNKDKVSSVIRKSTINNCENCIAKPYCGGGCIYANLTSSNIVVQSICRFIINSVKLQILMEVNPNLFNQYIDSNLTFDEFASSMGD